MMWIKSVAVIGILLSSMLSGCSSTLRYGAAGSSLSISGMQDAWLNDYAVSGEDAESEAVHIPYSKYQTEAMRPGMYFGGNIGPYLMQELYIGMEPGRTYRIAQGLTMWNLGFVMNLKMSNNIQFNFIPGGGVYYYSKKEELPPMNGRINAPDEDFTGRAPILLTSTGAVSKFVWEILYQGMFFQIGGQHSVAPPPTIMIGEKTSAGTAQLHARQCVGESGKNLACADYFNPVEKAQVSVSGAFLAIGFIY
ncbi:MAG: hypothetical protein HQM11_11095 [SAR324 cluster bacterium]|nr:hypothetical protein [SAR324 cluster bacterium]